MSLYTIEQFPDVGDYLDNLPAKAQLQIVRKLDNLTTYGVRFIDLTKKVVEKIDRNLYELKVKTKDFFCRIIFTFKQSVIWLLVAFPKKSNKIERKYLEKAKQRKKQLGC